MNLRLTAAAAAVALAASACSTGSTAEKSDETAAAGLTKAEAGAFPTTVKHAYGETTIESEPTRVVALGWSDADVVLSLGVVPVGASNNSWGGTKEGSTLWFDEALAEIDGAQAPTRIDDTTNAIAGAVADIAKLQPDLILATNSGMTKAEYDKLSKLGVPVVAMPGKPWMTTWTESLDIVGQALGRNKIADEVEADVKEKFEEAKEEYDDLQGKSAFVSWIDPTDTSSVGVYADSRGTVLEEVGLVMPEWVEKATKGEAYASVSAERAGTMDADLALVTAESQAEADQISKDKLIAKIPAFAAGTVWWDLPDHSTAYALDVATALSLPYMVDHLLPELEKALEDK
ncbi:ABC transporter substrate-binding protein [Nocardioides cavernaquae]|uniref:Iron-siderophore ABC transporter substrate-binding protein n=1 Tax=Nocardioides cavernaquae TaxID=2321396 RepID=A0A3A5HG64_9ACTN|nr:ABC transporter substrate-binding protein [Nocardioides cavernaquae]RJS47054.1 iron-siderophore ABC transporter substrate-binding protein [Nocardioides cavernaquae]